MVQLHITEAGKKLQVCLLYGDADFLMLCIGRTHFEQNSKVILHIQALIKYLVCVHNWILFVFGMGIIVIFIPIKPTYWGNVKEFLRQWRSSTKYLRMIESVANCFSFWKSQLLYHHKILHPRKLPQKYWQLCKLLSIGGEETGEHLELLTVGGCCSQLSPLVTCSCEKTYCRQNGCF